MAGELSPVDWTAVMVAQARAAETRRPDRVCADGWARHFVTASAQPVPEPDEHAATTSARVWQSLVDYQAVRTRYLDDYCQEASKQGGCRQVVLLAAGLDARAVRLDWPEGTTVFELDRAEVLQFKQQVLEQHGGLSGATAARRPAA